MGQFLRTVRHLRPVQIYGRVWFRLARPRPDLSAAPALRAPRGPWQSPAARQPSLTGPGAFRFLNEAGSLAQCGWDDPATPKLWRYNLHYFDDLNADGAAERAPWHQALAADWLAANPPGKGTAWEPYPTSLRIVNWIKWARAGHGLSREALQSLAVQTRWLTQRLEWHLLGNHLFANAKALVFAGLFFDGAEAARWLDTGRRILTQEIPEQILPDGGQFELSPMYHALAVEDMLDLVNIARAYGCDDLATEWSVPIPAMLDWLMTMTHPDGDLAFFNDTAMGIAPSNDRLLAYARSLGFVTSQPASGTKHLPASGYARLVRGPAVLIADLARVGPDYLPGHAHADTLSFELSLSGRRVIVNSGTSVYGLGPERERQRGTAAHSTVVVGGRNSSEVWSGFRVGRRALPFDVSLRDEGEALAATGAHDGYRHLPGAPVHRRTWQLTDRGLTVTDSIEGHGQQRIEAWFHLAPGFRAVQKGDYTLIADDRGVEIATVRHQGSRLETVASTWHPQFGLTVQNEALRIACDSPLPLRFETSLIWTVP
ncbi:MAG TPA: heparinase [Alphaproteobacteria bacterium]|nr:heparinase [Alphaproteobacteria bacterium]